jgi:hypothetical protein
MSSPAAAALAAASSSSVSAAASASPHVTLTFHDHFHFNMRATLTKLFGLDQSWLEVVEWFVGERPASRKTTWSLDNDKCLGTQVLLSAKLRDMYANLKEPQGTIVATSRLNSPIPYEFIENAIAFARAGLLWPLWQPTDCDVFNGQVLGAFDSWRARRGATIVHSDQNNTIQHLVGLKAENGLIKVVNAFALGTYVLHKGAITVQEPLFQCTVPSADLLRLCSLRLKDNVLLPIFEISSSNVSQVYHTAFQAYETAMQNCAGMVAERERVAQHRRNMQYDDVQRQAYDVIREGGTLQAALSTLTAIDNPERLAKARQQLEAYHSKLHAEHSLVQLYRESYKDKPHCDPSVHLRDGDECRKLFPDRFSVEDVEHLTLLHKAVSALSDRQLWESALSWTVPLKDDASNNAEKNMRAEHLAAMERLVYTDTAEHWSGMADGAIRDGAQAVLFRAQCEAAESVMTAGSYNSLTDEPIELSDEEKQALRQRARQAAEKVLADHSAAAQ